MNYTGNIENIKECIEKILFFKMNKVEETEYNIFNLNIIGLEINLYDNSDFEDNMGIEFSKYEHTISLNYFKDVINMEDSLKYMEIIAVIFAKKITKDLKCECLVVENMQLLLHTYR